MWRPLKRLFRRRPLTADEAEQIRRAIQQAERRTSGEIRVVVEAGKGDDPYRRAVEWFHRLGMTATQHRNGVLIYVDPRTHRFAIIGDEGIHQRVGPPFWQAVRNAMTKAFQSKGLVAGIIQGIQAAADALAHHFPHQGDADVNELPDEVIY